jgi:hypothetical protein
MKVIHFISYLFSRKIIWILITLLLVVGIFLLFYKLNFNTEGFYTKRRLWDKWFDPGISLFAALVTIFIALQNTYSDWKDSLPKRLTVHFIKDDKFIMTCHEAFLSGEADIRQWGQQIGLQMAVKEQLEFYPFITSEKRTIKYDQILKEVFKPYEVTFYLKSIPSKNNTELEVKYLVWWDNTDKTKGNKFVYFDAHPTNFKTIKEAEHELELQNIKIDDIKDNI